MTARKPKSRSGPNISEAQRGTKAKSLRLHPETWAALDAQAEAAGLSRSAYVARLVGEKSESPTRTP